MQEVTGNLAGLAPAQKQRLERVFRRRVNPHEVVSAELADFLAGCSLDTGRQVGILVDRRGQIEHVVVGDAHRLWLPDVGRLRAARGRFRGLRLIHTSLKGGGITQDDLTDLALLRLDLVATIGVEPAPGAGASEGEADGVAASIQVAHLVPDVGPGGGAPGSATWRKLEPRTVHGPPGTRIAELDVVGLMRGLEEEFARTVDRVASTDEGKDKALVVHVAVGRAVETEARVAELVELARTAGVRVLDVIIQRRPAVDPKTLLGRGKLEEVMLRAMQLGAELLIFDPDLTPGQARAISDSTELKVIDRTMLILDIFAQRAQTRDGKLQVELAQLRYTLPRLVEKNTMMSRLTGGIGGRGPGETKLEISRRRARERITRLEDELEELGKKRRLRREQRNKREVPIVSIVGYTNAGKSTLLNALTSSAVVAEDKLFATLDPTSRRLRFPREREVVITDTVGFIRDLPPDLQRAFGATLEELEDADLLLHVVDASDEDREQHMRAVDGILGELGLGERPRLLVFNKSDRLAPPEALRRAGEVGALAVSAIPPPTLMPLLDALERALWREGANVGN